MARILVTGATGFLGASLLKGLKGNYAIMATKRSSSSLFRLDCLTEKIQWVCTDERDWKDKAVVFAPEVIIHAAWLGVEARERDDVLLQAGNIRLLEDLLDVAHRSGTASFIGFGSQAEYGEFSGVVTEDYPLAPTSEYGRTKVKCAAILRDFCEACGINWYWLRLFSFFGEGQGENWLIPSAIKHMLSGQEMALTEGMQKYAYFYARDLGNIIEKILSTNGLPGIYNISGAESITIRELLERIRDKVTPSYALAFGTLPYRNGQAMHMAGSFSRFTGQIGPVALTPFDNALDHTIDYYKKRYKSPDP